MTKRHLVCDFGESYRFTRLIVKTTRSTMHASLWYQFTSVLFYGNRGRKEKRGFKAWDKNSIATQKKITDGFSESVLAIGHVTCRNCPVSELRVHCPSLKKWFSSSLVKTDWAILLQVDFWVYSVGKKSSFSTLWHWWRLSSEKRWIQDRRSLHWWQENRLFSALALKLEHWQDGEFFHTDSLLLSYGETD